MKSDFEQRAAAAAVDAVERRWAKNHACQRGRRIGLVGMFSIFIIISAAILLGIVYFGDDIGLGEVKTALSESVGGIFSRVADPAEQSNRAAYAAALRGFLSGKVLPLKELPIDKQPKNAAAGTIYRFLCQSWHNSYAVYEMTINGKGKVSVTELSPFATPRAVSSEYFKQARAAGPYLMISANCIYVCGGNIGDGETLQERLRRLAGVPLVPNKQ